MARIKNLFAGSLSFALFFLLAPTTWAQIDVGNFTISGAGEIGGLPRSLTGNKANFEEYRDIPETVIVPELQLIIGGKKEDYYLNFDAGKVGREDQNYSLRVGRYGLLDIQFEYEGIPHRFNVDNARTPYYPHGDYFALPSRPVFPFTGNNGGNPCLPPPAVNTNNVCNWLLDTAHRVDLSLLNSIARLNVRYTPNPGWTFTANYWSNRNDGKRAFGILNGFSSATMNISELPEPIDYQTHNVEVGGEYTGKWWSLALKYNGSFFHNNISTLIWDNPIHALTGGTCLDSVIYNPTTGTGPCRGQLDLYPDNQAHTISLTGTATLPLKTRFLGTVSYGWRLQNDSFLPFTNNTCYGTGAVPVTCADAALTPMPTINKHSLNGDVRPLMVNTTLVNNSLVDRLSLRAYYRLFDLSNKSSQITEPTGFIGNDRGATPVEGPNLQNDINQYSRNTAGIDASYQITRWLTGKFNYTWDKWHRNGFQTVDSTENTIGPTLDIKPLSWVLLRASYKHSWRDSNFTPDGNIVAFYLEKRDQDKVSLYADVSPFDTLGFHAGFDFINDRYPNPHAFPQTPPVIGTTNFGLHYNNDYSPSVGFNYNPLEWLKFFGDYNWDRNNWKLDMHNSNGVLSQGKNTVNTFSLGSDMDIIKNVLGFRIQYTFSQALVEINNSCPFGCTAPVATDYPNTISTWHELLARFDYQINKYVGLRLGYYFNAVKGKNFGVDNMQPWMGNIFSPGDSANSQLSQQRSIFLGDQSNVGPFTAYVGFVALRFKF
ncbi:MAG: MtrB/PioB family outer membrane beta-barrel protein [Alphaproteobacteria bacterium]